VFSPTIFPLGFLLLRFCHLLPPFVFTFFNCNKKGGKENFSLCPPAFVALFALLYQVPGFILDCFKKPQIDIHLHLVLALEILWHSPRVPADTASAILEFARGKYAAVLIDNFYFWRGDSTIVSHYHIAVMLSSLTDNIKIY